MKPETIIRRYPWVTTLEGREVQWEGRLWRFALGVPVDVGIANGETAPLERWASVADASRIYELRAALIRARVRTRKVRSRRFVGTGGRSSPVLYVSLEDVAAIRPEKRGPLRRKSVRAQPLVGAVVFRSGAPVPDPFWRPT